MPQLDLFGAPPPQQPDNNPAAKLPAKKKVQTEIDEEASVAAAAYAEQATNGNRLRSKTATQQNEEEKNIHNAVPPIVSLFDAVNEPGDFRQDTSLDLEEVAADQDQFTTQPPDTSIDSKSEIESQPGVAENGETEDKNSLLDTISEDQIVIEENVSEAENTQKQNPERTGKVVFDDGTISVKIKAKSSFVDAQVIEKNEKVIIIKEPQKRGRKSFKEIDAEADLIEVPDDEILFQKQYYPISEVAGWFKVNTSLLRFWENEFDVLKPRKNRKGDRLFRPADVKNLQLIYQLLRQRKYTIEGAKEYLKTNHTKADLQLQLTQTLQKFRSFLLDLKANLQS